MTTEVSNQPPDALPDNLRRNQAEPMSERDAADRRAPKGVQARPRDARVRLSFAQERLWFLQQWEPTNPAYHITRAYRLSGAVDRAALARSLALIVERHEVLRSVFCGAEDQPSPLFLPATALTLRYSELSHRPGGNA